MSATWPDPLLSPGFLTGGGECGELIRSFDWSATPLGAPERWPIALRTLVAVMLGSNQAMFLAWGPQRTMLYNDTYARICGARHPAALGKPFREVWFDIMDEVGPILERAFAGVATQMDDIAFTLHRHGYPEEAHFAFSYTPVRSDSESIEGMFCACTETTGQVLAARREAAERERQRLMLQHMPGFCALLVGPEHRFEYVNDAYVQIAGRCEFLGRTVREVFPEIADQGFFELLDRVYATGVRYEARALPIRLDRPDRSRFIDLLYEPLRDDGGRVIGIFVGGYDVTDRVRGESAQREVESALRRSERRYRSFVEASAQVIWRVNAAGCIDEPCPEWERYTGQSFEQSHGLGWMDAIHEADRPAVAEAWRRALATGETYEVEYSLHRHDGAWRTVIARGVPVRDVSDDAHPDEIVEWIGTCIDIEDRRTVEARLALALAGTSDGIWDWDLVTGVVYHSPRWIAMLGYTPDEWESSYENWLRHVHPDDLPATKATLARYLAGESAEYVNVFRMRHRDGGWRWLMSRAKALRASDGRPVRMVGAHTDITAQKLAEERLQEADRRKDEFLATLSHELRNPLAPIRTAAQVVGDPRVSPERLARACQVIQRQVSHMARLLDDLLDAARITRGKLTLKRQQVKLTDVVDAALEAVRPLLDRQRHRLHVQLPEAPTWLDADPLRLTQVLSNLLTNAAKYTDPGGNLDLAVVADGPWLRIEVRDDGIGIPSESLPRLFDMFSQAHTGDSRAEGGLGIGLALVKGLVELHGGAVEVASKGPGHGSTFVVRLPVRVVGDVAEHAAAPAPAAHPGRRVMIADDNRDAADTLALLLSLYGHVVHVVYDGRSALSLAPLFRPEVALLDIGMPDVSGHEVARALRQEPWAGALQLIALTGRGQEEDRRRAFEAGFDHHLTKPVDAATIKALLSA